VVTAELRASAMAAGGDAIARDAGGRVVFVSGALPGEMVRVELTDERRDFARARTVEVVEASPERVAPPCPHLSAGCGGCGWQHVAPAAQPVLKAGIVLDALRRLAGLEVEVATAPPLPVGARRTTVRVAVGPGGRLGYRSARSHDVVEVGSCQVAHPLLEELLAVGEPGAATELTLRCGARTGERMVVASPTAEGVVVPDDVVVVGEDELAAGRRAWITEEAAGRRWRVSARSFFQSGPEAAEALVATVGEAVGQPATDGERLVDLYGGVGLFAATVGAGRRTALVERSASSVADARANLADTGARVLRLDVDRWRPSRAEVVVADPPRSGLGKAVVAAVAATRAPLVVLVSCDAAALGRDASLLGAAGYTLESCSVIDAFPHTPHVEVVSTFRHSGRSRG
jgi:23S rRNA (uracil1939-C5)-methyltransferase